MAGLAAVAFALCYWIVDIKGCRKWGVPFAIYGMNAITIFAFSGLLGKTAILVKITSPDGSRISLWSYVFQRVFAPLASPVNASLMFAVAYVLLFLGLAWLMHRMKWFIKI